MRQQAHGVHGQIEQRHLLSLHELRLHVARRRRARLVPAVGSSGSPEDEMPKNVLIGSLLALGVSVWLASRVVDTHPIFALTAGLAVLLFSAYFVAHPR